MTAAAKTQEFLEKHHLVYKHEGRLMISNEGRQVLQTLQSVAFLEVVFANTENT